METINKICGTCIFAEHESGILCRCANNDMPNSIWDYLDADIESREQISDAFASCSQKSLKDHTASRYIAPMAATERGRCEGYRKSSIPQTITPF